MNLAWNRIWYGEVRVALRGPSAQAVTSVLQTLHRRQVSLYDVISDDAGCSLTICLQDFSELYRASRIHRVKMRFGARRGAPFLAKRAWHRKSFFIGLGLFIVALHILGSVIWQVSVAGVEGDTAAQLLTTARAQGIQRGAWRAALPDVSLLQDGILKALPNLLWVGVHINGGVATIEALEKVPGVKPQVTSPQNIVAAKMGVVRRVFATRGEVVVSPGQVVQAGQTLISGSLAGGTVQVAAEGKVYAEVWYTSKVIMPLQVSATELSGWSVRKYYLTLGNGRVQVWGFPRQAFVRQVDETSAFRWRIGHWLLPIGWDTVREYEVTSGVYNRSQAQAARAVSGLVIRDVQNQAGPEATVITQRVLHHEVANGNLYETVLTQMEEDIGVYQTLK